MKELSNIMELHVIDNSCFQVTAKNARLQWLSIKKYYLMCYLHKIFIMTNRDFIMLGILVFESEITQVQILHHSPQNEEIYLSFSSGEIISLKDSYFDQFKDLNLSIPCRPKVVEVRLNEFKMLETKEGYLFAFNVSNDPRDISALYVLCLMGNNWECKHIRIYHLKRENAQLLSLLRNMPFLEVSLTNFLDITHFSTIFSDDAMSSNGLVVNRSLFTSLFPVDMMLLRQSNVLLIVSDYGRISYIPLVEDHSSILEPNPIYDLEEKIVAINSICYPGNNDGERILVLACESGRISLIYSMDGYKLNRSDYHINTNNILCVRQIDNHLFVNGGNEIYYFQVKSTSSGKLDMSSECIIKYKVQDFLAYKDNVADELTLVALTTEGYLYNMRAVLGESHREEGGGRSIVKQLEELAEIEDKVKKTESALEQINVSLSDMTYMCDVLNHIKQRSISSEDLIICNDIQITHIADAKCVVNLPLINNCHLFLSSSCWSLRVTWNLTNGISRCKWDTFPCVKWLPNTTISTSMLLDYPAAEELPLIYRIHLCGQLPSETNLSDSSYTIVEVHRGELDHIHVLTPLAVKVQSVKEQFDRCLLGLARTRLSYNLLAENKVETEERHNYMATSNVINIPIQHVLDVKEDSDLCCGCWLNTRIFPHHTSPCSGQNTFTCVQHYRYYSDKIKVAISQANGEQISITISGARESSVSSLHNTLLVKRIEKLFKPKMTHSGW